MYMLTCTDINICHNSVQWCCLSVCVVHEAFQQLDGWGEGGPARHVHRSHNRRGAGMGFSMCVCVLLYVTLLPVLPVKTAAILMDVTMGQQRVSELTGIASPASALVSSQFSNGVFIDHSIPHGCGDGYSP